MSLRPYPSYKQLNLPWLTEIPEQWVLKPLKVVATCNDETLSETTDQDFEFDYVDISSVTLVDGIRQRERMTFDKAPSRARRIVRRGDSIVSTVRTYLKAVATIDEEAQNLIVSTGFAVLRPGVEINPRYLGYYIQSQGFVDEVVARSTGVSYPAILASELVTIPVPIPSLTEQKEIVRFLDFQTDQVDILIEKNRSLLRLLEEKRLAVITHAVTKGLDPKAPLKNSGIDWLRQIPVHWRVMKLKMAASIDYGIGGEIDTALSEGVNLISLPNILKNGELDLTNHPYCQLTDAEKATLLLRKDDLLFNWRNGSSDHLGKTALFNENGEFTHVSFLLRVRVKEDHHSSFIRHFLSGMRATGFFAYSKAGVNNTFNKEELKNLWIAAPPKAEQQKIATVIEKEISLIDRLARAVSKIIDQQIEYRSALITNAVTGRVDVRKDSGEEAAA